MKCTLAAAPLFTPSNEQTGLTLLPWHMQFGDDQSEFILSFKHQWILSGQLRFELNHQPIQTAQIPWKSRRHSNSQEIWSYNQDRKLSLCLTFKIESNQCVIDYLARSETPASFAIYHQFSVTESLTSQALPLRLDEELYQQHTRASQFSRIPNQQMLSDTFAATLTIPFLNKCELNLR